MSDFSVSSRARLWAATLILGAYPLLMALTSLWRGPREDQNSLGLPSSPGGLLLFGGLQLAVFGVFWVLFWALSRPNRQTLLWPWKDGFQPVWLGLLYSLGLRLTLGFLAAIALGLAIALGADKTELTNAVQNNGARELVTAIGGNRDPLYHALTLTFISFIVAGLREELWRVGVLAALWNLAPRTWSQTQKTVITLGVSGVLFGLGHFYQGPIGVLTTGILGVGLGWVMLHHRSIWPAVFAHGFINATTFALAPLAAQLSKAQ